MSGYLTNQISFLIDGNNNAVGLLDSLGREWQFPTPDISVQGDGGGMEVEATLISDGSSNPIGFNAQGRDFVFAGAFTPNTIRGLVTQRRALVVNALTGVPAGVAGGSADEFTTLPIAQN